MRPVESLANGGTAMTLLANTSGVTVIVRIADSLLVSCRNRLYGELYVERASIHPTAYLRGLRELLQSRE